ncbi:MAG: FAD-dependent oxidoreductase [Verrucomicrobiota bacterium]|jgi:4-methylaminobutanoate oxidase (formaldehyde-forming)
MSSRVPVRARVVVVGGGVAGTSVAWHLVQQGWRDVLLLEQNKLAGGTSWHAAGMVGRLRVSSSMMRINQDSAELYSRLKDLTGHDVGWRQVGSLLLARNAERMTQYRRTTGVASYLGVECHEISPAEAQARFPCIRVDDLAGAYWIPHDGRVLPGEVPLALARGARAGGATVLEGVRVTALIHEHGRVTGVRTAEGDVEAEWVVLAGGMWTRQLALAAGVQVPLHPVEHHYVVSNALEGADGNSPCTRDMDGSIYFRGEDVEGGGGVLLGAFQRTTKVWDVRRVPDDFSFGLLEPDWEKFDQPLREGLHRIPGLRAAGFSRFVNGPESFTPDNNFLLGETAELKGLFVAAGFNSAGIACGGGAGKALAEWIIGGAMPYDLTSVDVRRFGPWANATGFLRDRVTESLGLHYEMAWPNREPITGRNARLGPLHGMLEARGACFGTKGGWERPNWFATDAPGCAATPEASYSFGRQNWFPNHAREHNACRHHVALFDQSAFGKILVRGPEAAARLGHLCAQRIDVEPSRVVYTPMLNERGGYESDVTVLRLGRDEFLVVTGSAQVTRDLAWIRGHLSHGNAEAFDVTAATAVIGVMGPRSRDLLHRASGKDLSSAAFPFGTFQSLDVGMATVRAVRITYVGELGWELHVPAEQAAQVFAALEAAGRDLGVVNAGHYAINSLRLEKGYRAFGAELSPDETPFEAGLGFAVSWDHEFLGKETLLAAREQPRRKLLVQFVLSVPDIPLWGGEVIFRDGVPCGYTTSGAYGHTVGGGVALGYVKNPGAAVTPDWVLAGRYELLADGVRRPALAHLRTPYDPRRERILA